HFHGRRCVLFLFSSQSAYPAALCWSASNSCIACHVNLMPQASQLDSHARSLQRRSPYMPTSIFKSLSFLIM
ncbi:hypothetical protein EDD85DRAFT_855832, partial [Armillaria nabsnona]